MWCFGSIAVNSVQAENTEMTALEIYLGAVAVGAFAAIAWLCYLNDQLRQENIMLRLNLETLRDGRGTFRKLIEKE